MYGDHSPVPNRTRVIVLENGDHNANAIIRMARDEGAVTIDYDGDEIFWIVFANDPHRVCDFTERTLRQQLARPVKS